MINFRDIEQLSSYLDGQLSTAESTRLESRLISDPELASALNDIRAARGILRKLPVRKAPRNFTLTRKMVGLKPPLPRAYPIFRFSTAFATILLVISFAANTAISQVRLAASAPQAAYELGGSGGGGAADSAAATEAPAVEQPLLELPPPAPTQQAAIEAEPAAEPLQTAKEQGNDSENQQQPEVRYEAAVPLIWQLVLLVVIIVSVLMMWAMRRSAVRKWQ